MSEPTEHVDSYAREVYRQAWFALLAYSRIGDALFPEGPGTDTPPSEEATFLVWSQVQAMLGSVANISKLFWPPEGANSFRRRRGAALRALFHVDATSALFSRKMRDHLEHFDERLDDWVRRSDHHNVVDDCFGPIEGFQGFGPLDIWRILDTQSQDVSFRGDKVNLKGLHAELVRVKQIARSHWGPGAPAS